MLWTMTGSSAFGWGRVMNGNSTIPGLQLPRVGSQFLTGALWDSRCAISEAWWVDSRACTGLVGVFRPADPGPGSRSRSAGLFGWWFPFLRHQDQFLLGDGGDH